MFVIASEFASKDSQSQIQFPVIDSGTISVAQYERHKIAPETER